MTISPTPAAPFRTAHAAPAPITAYARSTEPPVARVIVVVNGPGEVAAWLFPFAAALAERAPNVWLGAALLPCVFASGAEVEVVRTLVGVSEVATPRETLRWILRGDAPHGFDHQVPTCVLHFGGEISLAILLGRRIHAPVIAYAESRPSLSALLDKVCMVDARDLPRGGTPSRKHRVVGNLMVNAAQRRVPLRAVGRSDRAPRTVALFAGSREYQVLNMLPFFVRVAGNVAPHHGDVRWVLAKSDFVSREDIARFASTDCGRVIEGENAGMLDDSDVLVSERGVRLAVMPPGEAMRHADLALTIPGTNTAELAALGIPMILVLPTHRLESFPLPGLAGLVGNVPVVGRFVKQAVARAYLRRTPWWAHPNRRAGEAIVPEMVGHLSAQDVAARVRQSLRAPLEPVAERLRRVMGPAGATVRLLDEVMSTLRQHGAVEGRPG